MRKSNHLSEWMDEFTWALKPRVHQEGMKISQKEDMGIPPERIFGKSNSYHSNLSILSKDGHFDLGYKGSLTTLSKMGRMHIEG